MPRLKALLVGVTEYRTRAFEPCGAAGAAKLVSRDMPSAEYDVGNMSWLLASPEVKQHFGTSIKYKCLTGRLDPPDDVHLDARITNKQTIVSEIKNWLFKDVQAGDQLLFYFSGHSILYQTQLPPGLTVVRECLCPSDTDWKKEATCITEADLFCAEAKVALATGACLEVVLETCSASGFANPGGLQLLPFACPVGTDPTWKNAAVWSASQLEEHSHSGPWPACSGEKLRGLFTQCYRDAFPGRTRTELLDEIKRRLDAYRTTFNSCCQGKEEMETQTPKLYSQKPNVRPLMKSCGVGAVSVGTGSGGGLVDNTGNAASTTVSTVGGCLPPLLPKP